MSWSWELLNLSGVTTALSNPSDVIIERRLNGSTTATVTLDAVEGLTSTARIVRGYRQEGSAKVLRYTGKVMRVTSSGSLDQLERVTLSTTDGYGVLSKRVARTNLVFAQQAPRAIVSEIINILTNLVSNTGLYAADTGISVGPLRDREYPIGKNLGEIIKQLAEVDDGFYFRVDPIDIADPVGHLFSELVMLYPTSGVASTAAFEWGAGTRGNLSAAQMDILPPVNFVYAFGAGDGEEQLLSTVSDTASIAAYGLYDKTVSFSDIIETATLQQHAYDLLRPNELKTVRVEVATTTGNPGLYVPSPWTDFEVGDTVSVHLASVALDYSGSALVHGFTVNIDSQGIERLTNLELGMGDDA